MKKIIIVCLSMCMMSLPTFGFDLETETNLTGSSSPTGTFYMPTKWNFDIVAGLTAVAPATKTKQLDVDLKLGVRRNLPLIGKASVFFIFDDYQGTTRTTASGSDFHVESVSVSKTWLYSLNDRVSLGLTAILGTIMLNGEKEFKALTGINPVLGVTITI